MSKQASVLKWSILIVSIILITSIIAGFIVLIYSLLPGSGTTVNAVVHIRFDMYKNQRTITLKDFNKYPIFKEFDCEKCDISENGNFFVSEMYSSENIKVKVSMGNRRYLNVFYYGDPGAVVDSVRGFLAFLRSFDNLSRGLQVLDPENAKELEEKDEDVWFKRLKTEDQSGDGTKEGQITVLQN